MADTNWTFARLRISVAGVTLRTTRRVRHRWDNGTTRAHDNTGIPRGLNEGEYEGSTEMELSTQEAAQIYEAVPQGGGDMNELVTVVSTWQPKEGQSGKAEAQGHIPEGEIVDEPNSESMVTVTLHHLIPLKLGGKSVREEIAA